ncbi:VPLPA-CTERM sorting domain-containing protein [Sulfitobacter sp. JB4-11]|uniref:VPLPA-CTERM sorting domain-containing protein n=1 Tax=Sulfitobacter rhodophyticola TaxID=3238304 RepID=UPI003511EFE3
MFGKFVNVKAGAAALAIAVSGFAYTSDASAGTVRLENEGSTPFGSPEWARQVVYSVDGEEQTSTAGLFRLKDSDSGQGILAWCVELLQELDLPDTYAVNARTPTAAVAANLNKLFTTSYDMVINSPGNDNKKRNQAAGFQLVIWEIITDTNSSEGLDLTNGDFIVLDGENQTRGGIVANAETFLRRMEYTADRNYMYKSDKEYTYSFFNNDESQDLISAEEAVAAVPVPAAGLLLLSGLAGFGAMRRRRKA